MQREQIDISKEKILLFDDNCNLCNGFVKFIIARDKRNKFKFTSIQSKTGQSILDKFKINNQNFTSIVLIIDGTYYIKSSAIFRLFKELGGFWKFFNIFTILPGFLTDFVYDIIAKNRYKLFGKRKTCINHPFETL